MSLEIITNHHWRPILYSHEIPEKVLENEFDWMRDPDNYSFFKYKDWYYCLEEIMVLDERSPFGGRWHGYHSDTFFSGILVEISDDGEMVKVGRYYS